MAASTRDKAPKPIAEAASASRRSKTAGACKETGVPAAATRAIKHPYAAEFTDLIAQVDTNIKRAGVLAFEAKKRLG